MTFTNVRVECCAESWNLHELGDPVDAFNKIRGCFCLYLESCADYDVTTRKFLTKMGNKRSIPLSSFYKKVLLDN